MKLSIVSTLYESESYVAEFCDRIKNAVPVGFKKSYEIILVNDGSPDNSLKIALKVASKNSSITVVNLSRNFGHHKAIMTGLSYAKGEYVFLIDSDLEEDPELLSLFLEHFKADEGVDVVYGYQKSRKGRSFERQSGRFFWSAINLLSGLRLTPNLITARLMRQKYVRALLLHREREVFLAGLWSITGFNQVGVGVEKKSRVNSTYTMIRKISLAVNSITSFSSLPLVWIFYSGLTIVFLVSIYLVYILGNWLVYSHVIPGWTSLMVSIWLLSGLMLCGLGIIGIYLSKIYSEVKMRPYTIVKEVYRSDA